jgi:hypothetical protein
VIASRFLSALESFACKQVLALSYLVKSLSRALCATSCCKLELGTRDYSHAISMCGITSNLSRRDTNTAAFKECLAVAFGLERDAG